MDSEKAVRDNIGLVHACARRFRGRGIEYDDLFQAGCLGLVKAAGSFDESRGVRFSTYAVPAILGEIKRLFRDGGTVKVGRSLKELSLRARRESAAFLQREGRPPTVGELAARLGVEPEQAAEALEWFRNETIKAGFPGLHLQAAAWGMNGTNLSGVDTSGGISKREFERMNFDSTTHYQFAHFTDMNRDYLEILGDVKKQYALIEQNYSNPYFPHVSVGWDNNPRYKRFVGNVTRNNTPENFETALRLAKDYLDRHPEQHRLITVNSWNEWTETSYLEPDNLYGYGYLEAIKRVFGE